MPTGKFDNDTYFILLAQDPVAAHEYIDQYRYKTENPTAVITGAVNAIADQRQVSVTESFLSAHPEFPAGDVRAAEALTQKVDELVTHGGFPYSANTVEFAWYQIQHAGAVEPGQQQTHQSEGAPTPNEEQLHRDVARAEALSNSELEKLMRKYNLLDR